MEGSDTELVMEEALPSGDQTNSIVWEEKVIMVEGNTVWSYMACDFP